MLRRMNDLHNFTLSAKGEEIGTPRPDTPASRGVGPWHGIPAAITRRLSNVAIQVLCGVWISILIESAVTCDSEDDLLEKPAAGSLRACFSIMLDGCNYGSVPAVPSLRSMEYRLHSIGTWITRVSIKMGPQFKWMPG